MILLFSHRSSVKKTVTANESSRRESEGEIPVELIDRQPFDDFPFAHGVSRTNGVLYIAAETRPRENNINVFCFRVVCILFRCLLSTPGKLWVFNIQGIFKKRCQNEYGQKRTTQR